jgi:hypothetical protein
MRKAEPIVDIAQEGTPETPLNHALPRPLITTMLSTALVLAALVVGGAEAGWCDSYVAGSTGYHCRGPLEGSDSRMCPLGQTGGGMYSQYCSCGYEMEMHSGRRQLTDEEAASEEFEHRVLQSSGTSTSTSTSSSRRRSSSTSSSRRRSSSTYVEIEYECDKVGEPTYCADGCNPATGQCVRLDSSQRCGTTWAGGVSCVAGSCATFNGVATTPQTLASLCPLQNSQRSFENIMTDTSRISNLLANTQSDMQWFSALMTSDLYAPNALSENVYSTCTEIATTSVPADKARCEAVTGDDLDTSAACHGIATAATVDMDIKTPACQYSTTITRPDSLRDELFSLDEYRQFTCSRNFPHCLDNSMQMANCLARCEAVSQKIADFSDQCKVLEAAEENDPNNVAECYASAATCVETATDPSVSYDFYACAAVTGSDLNSATACEAVMTQADQNMRACTYSAVAADAAACGAVDATAATGESDCYNVNLATPAEGSDDGACSFTPKRKVSEHARTRTNSIHRSTAAGQFPMHAACTRSRSVCACACLWQLVGIMRAGHACMLLRSELTRLAAGCVP